MRGPSSHLTWNDPITMSRENMFQDGIPTRFGMWGLWQPFSKWQKCEFSMPHISANKIGRKLMFVSISKLRVRG